MDSDNQRAMFDELVCAMKLASEAYCKPSLSQADRKIISERILLLSELLAEVATAGELPFDIDRAKQIREKVREITEVVETLIEKGEAL